MSSPSLNISLVEDHDLLRDSLLELLRVAGYRVKGVSRAESMNDEDCRNTDILIVDLNLPGEDGISLVKRFRVVQPVGGVIMVTARTHVRDRILGYASGADIYMPKPVGPEELLAGVQALERRMASESLPKRPPVDTQALQVDQVRLKIMGPAAEVDITEAEVTILHALSQAPKGRLDYWKIIEVLGSYESPSSKHNLEVRVARLRKKLIKAGSDALCIRAIRWYGYQLCIPLRMM